MNVVYHNLINNSHSIINQSKLHHFHLYSSGFFSLFLLFLLFYRHRLTLSFKPGDRDLNLDLVLDLDVD